MKASYNWIRELVGALADQFPPPVELAKRFTKVGLEVEGITEFGAASKSCVIAKVQSIRPHPTKSGLRLVTIDAGKVHGTLEVVCGAPNVPEAGGRVVFAPLGTHLPAKGLTLEAREIGGVKSLGMLCSEAELGTSDQGEGLWLPETGEPGDALSKAIPSSFDTIFEIGLTPNRPDGLGHIGLAREAAAILNLPFTPNLKKVAVREIEGGSMRIGDLVAVSIEAPDRSPHYGALLVKNVKVERSPLWMRHRLTSLGLRSISNVVDITNYLLLFFGQPTHAFDLAHVDGNEIIVRTARAGEKLKTLDGIDRVLTEDDLVIADKNTATGLAGIMGGEGSEITDSTTDVLLEVAYFSPRGIRRAARRHGMHTDASHRFERGIDHGIAEATLAEADALFRELAHGARVGEVQLLRAKKLERPTISLRASKLDQLLGVQVPFGDVPRMLESLGCETLSKTVDSITVRAPSHRPDLSREEDLVEEVMRLYGIDLIPTVLPRIRPTREVETRESRVRLLRAAAVQLGLGEAVTYGFVSPADLEKVFAQPATVALQNPLSQEQSVMRTSLLPTLLQAAARARRHGVSEARLFTIGSTFEDLGGDLPKEELRLCAVLAGEHETYLAKPVGYDVWDALGLAEGLIERLLRRKPTFVPFSATDLPRHLHPRGAARVTTGDKTIGSVGLLHPEVLESFELTNGVVFDLDAEATLALIDSNRSFESIPRYPSTLRDLSLVVTEAVRAGDVEEVALVAARPLGQSVSVFDRFTGGSVPAGHVSLAFRVTYRASDRTLKDEEVDKQHAKVVAEVEQRFLAKLRA